MSMPLLAPDTVTLRVATVRGQRVLRDSDLATLYEVETTRFSEAARSNLAKFPADVIIQPTADEWAALRSQCATLDAAAGGRGRHRTYLPCAFTEHGAIMAANLLISPHAIEVSVYVVQAIVRMRELATTHGALAKWLAELEGKTGALAMSHDTFSRKTHNQLKHVFDALRALMTPLVPPTWPIGFATHEDRSKRPSGSCGQTKA
jgi:hypothetical protein